jgi:chromosome segregation ATPase
MMKFVYLTENGIPENLSLPSVNAGSVEHLAFLDAKAFKKLRKKIKTEYKNKSDTKASEQKIVIIYSTPATVIASGLRCQIAPEQVISQWVQQAEALVELFKDYPSSCILANMNALKADMDGLMNLVSMNKKEKATFNLFSKQVADADIYTLSAHYMLNNHESLKRQLLMLDACTAFNEYTEDVCDIQNIFSQQQAKEAKYNAELNTSQLAIEQQQAEMAALQQQLKALANQLTQEKAIVTESQTKHAQALEQQQAKEAQLQKTIQQLTQEKDASASQLQASQKEAKSQLEKTQSVMAEKDALNNTLKSAQADLANQTAENEQIIEQLHLVQESFEESILAANKLKADMLTLENKNTALQKQIERIESHQAWLVKELLASHQYNAKSWSYRSLMKKQVAVIKASGLFDEAWYLKHTQMPHS